MEREQYIHPEFLEKGTLRKGERQVDTSINGYQHGSIITGSTREKVVEDWHKYLRGAGAFSSNRPVILTFYESSSEQSAQAIRNVKELAYKNLHGKEASWANPQLQSHIGSVQVHTGELHPDGTYVPLPAFLEITPIPGVNHKIVRHEYVFNGEGFDAVPNAEFSVHETHDAIVTAKPI